MQLSPRAKLIAALLGLVVIVAYLLILDLGIHAGRVHRGVSVAGHDVSRMTFPELIEELERRRDELMDRPLTFTADGVTEDVTPAELGWSPQPFDTARATFEVGREGAWAAAAGRLRAWFGGVDVDWAGGVRSNRVGRLIAKWERSGLDVDEKAFREVLRNAVGTDRPESYVVIPVVD